MTDDLGSAEGTKQSIEKWSRRLKKANYYMAHAGLILNVVAPFVAVFMAWQYHVGGNTEAMYPWMVLAMVFVYMAMESFESVADVRGWAE